MTVRGTRRRWTRDAYHRAAIRSVFDLRRVELVAGAVVVKTRQTPGHFTAIGRAASALRVAFGVGFAVREQGPVTLSAISEPEPDIVVIAGDKSEYVGRHPRAAEVRLLVEVSDTTLSLDRGRKAALYARAGIADYWIVNVNARTLEVRRDPVPNTTARARRAYLAVTTLAEADTVSPLAAPGAVIRVADLLHPLPPAAGEA